jgi:hypothetical protein
METSSKTALVLPGRTGSTYLRRIVFHPISISAVGLAACFAAVVGGLLVAALAVAIMLGAAISISMLVPVRRALERWIASGQRRERERERERRLDLGTPCHREQYDVLRDLVQEAERADAAQSERFGLEELLDDFVRIAEIVERRQRATNTVGPLPGPRTATGRMRAGTAAEVISRRMRLSTRCLRDREVLAGRLESIDQLIRLVACHIACPTLDDRYEHAIDRRLEDLDAVDAALVELGDADAEPAVAHPIR